MDEWNDATRKGLRYHKIGKRSKSSSLYRTHTHTFYVAGDDVLCFFSWMLVLRTACLLPCWHDQAPPIITRAEKEEQNTSAK